MTDTKDTPSAPHDEGDKTGSTAMTAREEILDILKTVGIAVAITLFVRFFFFQPFNIPSGSMKPTLLVGDFIVVDKIEYGYSRASLIYPLTRMPVEGRLFSDAPDRGEIVVFKNANDKHRDYIKRVIGLPGDTVQMISGSLYLNGERVAREPATGFEPQCDGGAGARAYRETLPEGPTYIIQECQGDRNKLDNTQRFVVPDGHYFLMGDNRDNSADSRTPTVDFVPHDQIIGRATRVAFSVDGDRARFWQIWKWPMAVRYGRLLDPVE